MLSRISLARAAVLPLNVSLFATAFAQGSTPSASRRPDVALGPTTFGPTTTLYDFNAVDIDGAPVSLATYRASPVAIVVNVASEYVSRKTPENTRRRSRAALPCLSGCGGCLGVSGMCMGLLCGIYGCRAALGVQGVVAVVGRQLVPYSWAKWARASGVPQLPAPRVFPLP